MFRFNGANKLFSSAEGQHLMLWFGVGLLNASAFFMARAAPAPAPLLILQGNTLVPF